MTAKESRSASSPAAPVAADTPASQWRAEPVTGDHADRVAEVRRQLRIAILSNIFPESTPLPSEGKLATSFAVSRTVIREAMRSLRAEGLVEVSQGRRPHVKPATTRQSIDSLEALLQRKGVTLNQVYETRGPLEGHIAALAAERATDADLAALESSVERLEQVRQEQDWDHWFEADLAFHQVLASATGNPVAGLIQETLLRCMHHARQQTPRRIEDRAIQEHREILEAVRARNPKAARDAMRRHLPPEGRIQW